MSEEVRRLRAACEEAVAWFHWNRGTLTKDDKHDIAIALLRDALRLRDDRDV